MRLLRWLIRAYWKQRLAHAHRYRAGIEGVMRNEVAKAQYELDYCRSRLARAETAAIEARANRKLAKATP